MDGDRLRPDPVTGLGIRPVGHSPAAERGPDVSESYELTPMQEGMLFHYLADADADADFGEAGRVRPYVEQFVFEFTGPLDLTVFRGAWRVVVDRHTILRTAFVLDDADTPVQAVHAEVEPPVTELDWRDAGPDERDRALERLLVDDRGRGFDLARPPLMRFTVARSADDRATVVWSFHHLLLDGWSTQLVQREFFTVYRAASTGGTPELAAPVPFRRYVEWLRRQPVAEAEEFWRERLKDFTAPTALGVDRATGDSGFDEYGFALDHDLVDRARAFARSNRVTLNTVVQGVWALLLARYSGGDDVLFGATVSGRPAQLPDVQHMVGLFINTLPVRVTAAGGTRVGDWLRTIQDEQVDLYPYAHCSLRDVKRHSGLPPDAPLFHSIIAFENFPKLLDGSELPDGLTRRRLRTVERSGYALGLVAADSPAGFGFRIMYDRGRLDRATVERMAGHLRTLLCGMVDGPDAALRDVPMLTATELDRLRAWNDNRVEFQDHRTVLELIERQVARRPDAVAVSFRGAELTYRQLNARANQLSRHLGRLGVRGETTVGVCLERGPDTVVALLGILKSGAAYVPLGHDHPVERLEFILRDCDVDVLVTSGHLATALPVSARTVVRLDSDRRAIAAQPDTDPAPLAGPDDLAYVIYTSGSTGKPKGVMIEHRSLSNRMQENRRQFQLTERDTVLQFASLTFDASVVEIFPALIAGAKLLLRDEDWDPSAVVDALRTERVTCVVLPPFLWSEITARLRSADELGDALRLVCLGGEQLSPTTVRQWFQRCAVPLLNLYGPTEATVNVTSHLLTRSVEHVPIGRPMANTFLMVADVHGRPAPIGAVGELWIGGTGVARGYLNRPGLTEEKFVRSAVPGRGPERMYRSGDLARWRPDGTLDFLGRVDSQVKLRGFRIEPGEIESVLLSRPDVAQCVVEARDDASTGRRLVAYCVPAPHERPEVGELREHCRDSLPAYLVPAAFVILEALPTTANGKGVDRRALPDPDPTRPGPDADFVAPRTATERRIADVLREVLGVDRVGAHDDFFALGGDSLLSIRVVAKARHLGIRLTVQGVLRTPTVAGLAARADADERRAGGRASRSAGHHRVVGDLTGRVDSGPATVRLNDSTAEGVVFCLPEGGGSVTGYTDLAAALSPVARVIGVEARCVSYGTAPLEDVAAMATECWSAMRAHQPSGPYLLVGWSFGGLLAVGVADLVRQAGERVELLVALDSCLPVSGAREVFARNVRASERLLSWLGERRAGWEGVEPSGEVPGLLRRLNLPPDVLSLPHEEVTRLVLALDTHGRAALRYTPPTLHCPVLVFEAEGTGWPFPLAETWRPFAGRLRARSAVGDHRTLLRPPGVRSVAAGIVDALTRPGG